MHWGNKRTYFISAIHYQMRKEKRVLFESLRFPLLRLSSKMTNILLSGMKKVGEKSEEIRKERGKREGERLCVCEREKSEKGNEKVRKTERDNAR